jgi:hypothetical protein
MSPAHPQAGAVANFDWRPNDDVKLYARLMYSKFDDNETRNRFRFFFPGRPASYTGLNANGGVITPTHDGPSHLVRLRNEITDTTTLAFGGDFNVGKGVLTLQGTHAKSEQEGPDPRRVRLRSPPPDRAWARSSSWVRKCPTA